MIKPLVSYRRIDQLKARTFDCGFTNEDAKHFGKLSKTATWEALLETYGIPSCVDTVNSVDKVLDTELDIVDTTVDSKFLVRQKARGGPTWAGGFMQLGPVPAGRDPR